MAQGELEPKVVSRLDNVEKANSKHDAVSEPYTSSEPEGDSYGVPLSIRSLSSRDAVTTPEYSFVGVPGVSVAVGVGVHLPGHRYSGPRSSLEVIIIRRFGVTDVELPLE